MTEAQNPAGFLKWLAGIQPKLRRLAGSIVKDHAAAEDIVQETLLSVWGKQSEGKIRNLSAYASRAVWINAIKYLSRRPRWLSLDPEAFEKLGIPEPTHHEETEIMPWELEEAIAGLPAFQQTVIRMRYYTGFSLKETGKALGISMHTAASRSRYALSRLKDELQGKRRSQK